MPFYYPKGGNTFFKHINNDQAISFIQFDFYYFMLMAGFAKKRKKVLGLEDKTEMIDDFPKKYKPHKSSLIISLFLSLEMDILRIDKEDKKALQEHIGKYLTHDGGVQLSPHGQSEIDKYAFGGLDVLEDTFDSVPQTFHFFITTFHKNLKNFQKSS